MNFATLCSGIGAPEVAAHRLGMTPAFCSEIEPFPCAVLAHHWPTTPNYGDMTAWRDWPRHDLDLLIAGTPCQAFSVAGLRQGLDDARGNLTLEFARYADHVRPRFVLWENVPGVLSDKSNAFGCLLGGLAGTDAPLLPRGKRWGNAGFVAGPRRQVAWRILDAQHFGIPQGRRRIWLCAGDLERGAGDWACARALFPERERFDGSVSEVRAGVFFCFDTGVTSLDRSSKDNVLATSEGFRFATPREVERAFGFPDGHTAVQYRKKPACDGPRYKALGNSMAVPCVQWILANLTAIDKAARRGIMADQGDTA